MPDPYNSFPELSREERSALLERAVLATFEARGCPMRYEQQIEFDAAVDLLFAMSCCMMQLELAAQQREFADQAAIDGR